MMQQQNEIHRDLGRFEGQIHALEARLEQQNLEIASMRKDIRVMLEFTQQARGSWKTLMAAAGLASAFTAFIAKIVPFLVGR